MTVVATLQAALAVEHQVVYGYGLAAAHLSTVRYRQAIAALVAAEARRDQLTGLLRTRGVTPVSAAPAYVAPQPVTDAASAASLCRLLEHTSAGAAWDLAVASPADSDARGLAVEWLGSAAVNATRWAGGADQEPALPGQPS
jgi:hypothetical protein